jgi:hypothetical protein
MIRYWEQSKRLRKSIEGLEPLADGKGVSIEVQELVEKALELLAKADEHVSKARNSALSSPPAPPTSYDHVSGPQAHEAGNDPEPPFFTAPTSDSVYDILSTPEPLSYDEQKEVVSANDFEEEDLVPEADIEALLPGPSSETEVEDNEPLRPWLPGDMEISDLKGLRYVTVEEHTPSRTLLLVQAWPAVTAEGELSWGHVDSDGKTWHLIADNFTAYVREETGEAPEQGLSYAAKLKEDLPHGSDVETAREVFESIRRTDSL